MQMRIIKEKLNNTRGASIIIAMVFMLFCLFVGGSVLTSATANANRLQDIREQQTYENQYSAIMLLADELRTKDGSELKMTVTDDGTNIDFRVNAGQTLNATQRILFEAAIWNYLRENSISPSDLKAADSDINISINGFSYRRSDDVTEYLSDWRDFWLQPQTFLDDLKLTVDLNILETSVALQDDLIMDCKAELLCDEAYCLHGSILDTKLRLSAKAHSSYYVIPSRIIYPDPPVETETPGETIPLETTPPIKVSTIFWQEPKIQKGVSE